MWTPLTPSMHILHDKREAGAREGGCASGMSTPFGGRGQTPMSSWIGSSSSRRSFYSATFPTSGSRSKKYSPSRSDLRMWELRSENMAPRRVEG